MQARTQRRTAIAAAPQPTVVVDKFKKDEVIAKFYIPAYAYVLVNTLKTWDAGNEHRFEVRHEPRRTQPDLLVRLIDTYAPGRPCEIGQCRFSGYAHAVKNFLDVNAPGRYQVLVVPGGSEE